MRRNGSVHLPPPAVVANGYAARARQAEPDSLLLLIKGTTDDTQGIPIESSVSCCAATVVPRQ
jgi:DNA-binding GntR family transcriptional regulator